MIKFDNSSAQFDRMLDEINRPNSLGQRAAIIAGAGAMVLAACGGGDSDRNLAGPTAVASVDVAVPVTTEAEAAPEASFASADTTDDSDAQDDSSDNTSAVDADAAEPVDATDESLRERTTENTNCGGEVNMTSMEDFSYKFDFFSENKELAESLFDVTVNDAKYGMGQEAFDLISEHAYINGNTDAHGLTTGSEDMDALVQLIDSAEQKGDKAFVNGDCRNIENAVSMPSPDLPSITLKDGSSKEGVYLPADKLDELKEVMKNIERFEMMETTIMIDDEEIKVVFITLFANGCDNPIRLKIPVPTPPTVPTTTPEETTTTTTPEETTTTTTPEET
ncbi:hypothetical protein KC992_04715, partial [Candidatus Saccharibacteria bacterium]|nr:hypothetical protein [Candidatus Saccharibacteria bacterium]